MPIALPHATLQRCQPEIAAMRALVTASLIAASLAPFAAALAQEQVMTLAQVERRYRTMNEVHILKCDYDGDQLFTRTEMICVSNIYRALYVDRN
jgi:hypothetical protein